MPDSEAKNGTDVVRVSTLELFFDLVFVFAITQVSHLFGRSTPRARFRARGSRSGGRLVDVRRLRLAHEQRRHRSLHRARSAALCAWRGSSSPRFASPPSRDVTASRSGSPISSSCSFTRRCSRTRRIHPRAPSSECCRSTSCSAIAVLASGVVREQWNWIPWTLAGIAIIVATVARRERGFQLSPSHFVERHGLVVLIALGESVVATGAGAADLPVGSRLVAWVVIGLALAAALWWSYFDGDDERAEHAMTRASGAERTRLAVLAYYYAHLVMIAGIVMTAAGVHEAVAHVELPAASNAWLISGGVAVYLAGAAAYRWLLAIGPARPRLVAAAIALGTVPIGEWAGSLIQLALVVVVLVGMLGFEHRTVPVQARA